MRLGLRNPGRGESVVADDLIASGSDEDASVSGRIVGPSELREPGVELSQIAKDFGIHFTTLYSWMKKADVEDGERPGATATQSADLREARKRIRLLEQENEVLRRAAAYLSQANLPGKGSTRS